MTTLRQRMHATGGCEDPRRCEWIRIHFFPGDDRHLELKLCGFHREVAELASKQRRTLSRGEALSLHEAGWRALR